MEEIETLQDFKSISDDDGVLKKVIQKGWIPIKPSHYSQITAEILRTYEDGPKKGKVVESDEEKEPIWTVHFEDVEDDSEGLKCALLSMELGEISEFILKPEYTDNGETLHYRIKLVDFGMYYECPTRFRETHIIRSDFNFLTPGQKVDICAKGYCNGELYHEHKSSVYVNDAGYAELPRTVIANLGNMGSQGGWIKLNDTREISTKEREKFGFPSYGAVWYNVKIISSEGDDGGSIKKKADDFFRAGKSQLAEKIYEHFISMLNETEPEEVYVKALLNAALASLQNGHPDKCIRYCLRYKNRAKEDERSHFRLGQAYFMKYDFRKAEEHFKKALEFCGDNNKSEILQAAHLSDRKYATKYDKILKTMKVQGPVLLAREI